jgi:hypothetical protein
VGKMMADGRRVETWVQPHKEDRKPRPDHVSDGSSARGLEILSFRSSCVASSLGSSG